MPRTWSRLTACLWLAALCLAPAQAEARTLSQLRGDVRLLVRDTGSSRNRFSNAQIDALLNEAQRIAASRSYCVHKSTTFYLLTGTTYYATKSDFLAVRRLTRDWQELKEMTPAALDGRTRTWGEVSGLPVYYFVNFASRSQVGFSPFPAVSTDTGTIRMDYYALPASMDADAAEPFDSIGELTPFHQAPTYYAAGILAAVDGDKPQSDLYIAMFEAVLKVMSDKCSDRPNYNPSFVGRP